MNHNILRRAGNEYLIPTNRRLPVLVYKLLHALTKIGLQLVIRFVVVRLLEFLNLWIRVPRLSIHFVSTDVEIVVGKELGHFSDENIEKLVGLLVSGIHRRIHHAPFFFDLERSRRTGDFGIPHKPGAAVAGHIKFRNDANSAIARVRNQLANFVLRVIRSARPHAMQLRQFLGLGAKSLIVRDMPVKDVHLHRFHSVQVPLEHFHGRKVPARIDQQAAPAKSRLVLDAHCWCGKSIRRHIHELQKSLQAAQNAERIRRIQFCARGRYLQRVGIVLTRLLNFLAGVVRMHNQRRLRRLRRFAGNEKASLPLQL